MASADRYDVSIIGTGPAGLTAGIFTARGGLDTLLVGDGESTLARNAHLENVPGFPAGVSARRFLDMTLDQAIRNGCEHRTATVTRLSTNADGFEIETSDGIVESDAVICSSWADSGYLADLEDVSLTTRGSKTYVDTGPDGETDVDGLYVAGRLARKRHQTVVSAGDGANVALALLEASEVPFYHDWVAPEGYFTERGREIPPGCEEIDDEEREEREKEAMREMRERFSEPHPSEPNQHPDVPE